MRPIAKDVSGSVCLSVCVLDTLASPTKMAEPIVISFAIHHFGCEVLGSKEPYIIWDGMLTPPGDYIGLIFAVAVIRP